MKDTEYAAALRSYELRDHLLGIALRRGIPLEDARDLACETTARLVRWVPKPGVEIDAAVWFAFTAVAREYWQKRYRTIDLVDALRSLIAQQWEET